MVFSNLTIHIKNLIFKQCIFLIIYLFNCFPIKKKKIFFFSYYGSQYGCNPKYITEYIVNNYPNDQFDLVWAFNDLKSKEHVKGIRKVKIMSLKYFYELCTAKVIITNFRTTDFFVKRKKQFYIQTWHSSLRLKQIEKDAENVLPPHYIKMAKKDSIKCNVLLSGCKYSTEIFKRAFWYDGKILESGTPRSDLFFTNQSKLKEKILAKLGIPIDRKIVLYAPTFRKNHDLTIYNVDYEKTLMGLGRKFGGEWLFLVKLHPHLISQSHELLSGSHVMDVTSYDDIQELLSITDLLISDYSSLIFDFSLTKRPCFLYTPDIEEYISKDRNLYFNIESLPFKCVKNNEELMRQITLFDNEKYQQELNRFQESIGSYEDGNACERIVTTINEVMV